MKTKMTKIRNKVFDYTDEVSLYGLSLVVFLAGATKFTNPSLWLGFEPQWLMNFLPLTAKQFMFSAGAVETLAGLALASGKRTRIIASSIGLWLLAITVTVASMGLWGLAIRDIGLVVLAYMVASQN